MAAAFVKDHTVASNKTAGTTLALTLDTAVPAGNLIVCRMVFDNAATASKPLLSSITRAAGETNTWATAVGVNSTSTSAGAFASGAMTYIQTTVQWPAGSYTVTLDTSTVQKAGFLQEFTGTLATLRSTAGTAYSTTTTAASATTTGTTPVIGDLVLGCLFHSNTPTQPPVDNDTTGGAWSASTVFASTGGNAATNNAAIAQYKVLTAASHQTHNAFQAPTAGNGAIVIILQQYVPPAITQAAYGFYNDGTEAGVLAIDSYSEANYDGSLTIGTTYTGFAQSFLGTGQQLGSARFYLNNTSSATGSMFAKVYATTGTHGTSAVPTGAALATSDAVNASTVGASFGWITFPFSGANNITLTNGTVYAVTVEFAGTFMGLGSDSSAPTHGGNGARFTASAWTAYTAGDLIFSVASTTSTALAAANTPITADVTNGDVNVLLRERLQSTNTVATNATDDWQLQWEKNASGTWTNVAPAAGPLVDAYSELNADFSATKTLVDSGDGQSFLGNGQNLTRAGFFLSKTGSPPGTITSYLFAHTGTFGTNGAPTGTALATSTTVLTATSLGTTAAWCYFDFDGTFTLVNGTPYVIVARINTATDISNCVNFRYDNSSSTHAGNRSSYTTFWTNASGDLVFEVYSTSSTTAVAYNSPNLTDGAATTNRLGAGTGSFVAGKVSEDGLVDDLGWTANNYTEVLYSLALKQADLANGDTLRFRTLYNGATTNVTYTQTPTVNVTKIVAAVTQAAYRFYDDGTETASAALAVQDTAYAMLVDADVNVQLRARLQSTTAAAIPSTDDWQLQWERAASGLWTNVGAPADQLVSRFGIVQGPNNGDSLYATSPSFYGQSFFGGSRVLKTAGFMLRKTGAPNGTLVARLYAHTGTYGTTGTGTGAVLATSTTTINASDLTTTFAWTYFAFDGTFTPVDGVVYVIGVFSTNTANASNTVDVAANTTSAGSGNESSLAPPSSWTAYATSDLLYEIYSTGPSVVDGYNSPNLTDGAATTNRLGAGVVLQAADSYPLANADTSVFYGGAGSSTRLGQTFLGDGKTLSSVQFQLHHASGATGTAVAAIYATTGTHGTNAVPTGAALATSDAVDVALLPTTSGAAATAPTAFAFSGANQITLTNAATYAVVVQYSGATDIAIGADLSSPTHAGNRVTMNASSVWSATATQDVCFIVTSSSPASPPPGSFVPGKVSEDGLVDNLGWTANDYTEVLYSLTVKAVPDLANGNALRFRVLRNGATTSLTYTQTPRLNVSKTVYAISSIVDTFDTTLDRTLWQDASPEVTVVSGQAAIPVSNNYYVLQTGFASGRSYKFSNSSVYAKITLPTVAGTARECLLEIQLQGSGAGDRVYMRCYDKAGVATIEAQRVDANTYNWAGEVTYDPVAMAWWRIREVAGTTYFDTSPDGTSWTNFGSGSSPTWDLTKTVLKFDCGQGAEPTGTFMLVDNVNTLGAVTPSTGKIKWYSGSAFVEKPVKWYSGSAFVEKPLKVWNGSAWVLA